ncbi:MULTISPECIES: hypothetical protein [Sporosarcina]|uniref:hypothetical protein n=1 Tax=Sporosarcina TaxID=1569 RepID=UPI00129B5239|nr:MULTISPECIES: hypothetical protein [Sporosarcina]GKV64499.1 hypothetical protein NCCP2331_06520 [Sporosarcina sp. NCCP-2331]GLB57531.1 hypothetical protein NCCP2378_33200 [Sporosarcina sp. NCCP-2378]
MNNKIRLLLLFAAIAVFALFFIFTGDSVVGSTTEYINVIDKDHEINSDEQWIVLANERQVYIEDFSIWALIEVDQNYTVDYVLMKKSGRHILRKIVPGDYKGRL